MSSLFQLPPLYLLWHYTRAWGDLVRLYRNLAWFLWHFFSIGVLSQTLFAPWKRLYEGRNKDTAGLLGSIIMNLILRVVGLIARTSTICFGFFAIVILSVGFVLFLLVWPLLPIVVVGLLMQGSIGVLAA